MGNTLTDGPKAMVTGITLVDNNVQVNQNSSLQKLNPVREHLWSSNHINSSVRPASIQNMTQGRSNDPPRTYYGAAMVEDQDESTRLQN